MSNENSISEVNAKRLLWAGFMAILAAGVGFAIRGGIFDNWGAEYGFTATQLGAIGGMGFSGFCFGIIIGGVIVDKVGYGKLVFAAYIDEIRRSQGKKCARYRQYLDATKYCFY